MPGSGYFVSEHLWGGYAFVGAAQRYVAYDITLDERPSFPAFAEAHFLELLDHAPERAGPDDIALVASYTDLRAARRLRFRRFILAQHGAGQSYGGDARSAQNPACLAAQCTLSDGTVSTFAGSPGAPRRLGVQLTYEY